MFVLRAVKWPRREADYSHLVPMLRICRAIPPFQHMSSGSCVLLRTGATLLSPLHSYLGMTESSGDHPRFSLMRVLTPQQVMGLQPFYGGYCEPVRGSPVEKNKSVAYLTASIIVRRLQYIHSLQM